MAMDYEKQARMHNEGSIPDEKSVDGAARSKHDVNIDPLTGEYKLVRQLKSRHIAMIRYGATCVSARLELPSQYATDIHSASQALSGQVYSNQH